MWLGIVEFGAYTLFQIFHPCLFNILECPALCLPPYKRCNDNFIITNKTPMPFGRPLISKQSNE